MENEKTQVGAEALEDKCNTKWKIACLLKLNQSETFLKPFTLKIIPIEPKHYTYIIKDYTNLTKT